MTKKVLNLLALCLISTQFVQAGGFKIGMQGNKQLGIGHTGVGFAQDAGTIYFNPAAMGMVKSQITGSVFALAPTTSFLETNTNTLTEATGQVFTPFSLYGTAKLGKKINVGLGVYTPFGSGVMYPTEWTGRYILNRINLQTIYIQPTISYKISKMVSIGAGYIFANGNVLLEKDIPLYSSSNTDVANVQLKGKGKGKGYNVGFYLGNQESKLGFGLTYHSKVTMKVTDGDAIFSNIPVALSSSFPAKNKFSSEITMPAELAVGASYKLSKKVTAAVDVQYTYWNSYDSLGFDYKINSASLTDKKSARLYKNAVGIHGGIQAQLLDNFIGRVGAFYDATPIQDGYVSPELPDNNKTGFTLGGTYVWRKNLLLDFSLLYENVPARTQTNIETGLNGTFKTKAIAPGVGITYFFGRVQKREKSYRPRYTGAK